MKKLVIKYQHNFFHILNYALELLKYKPYE